MHGESGMRSGITATFGLDHLPRGLQVFLRRQFVRLVGLVLLLGVTLATAALATWNVTDPSFSHATGNVVTNAVGFPGAVFADIAMQFFGLGAVTALLPAVFWGAFLASARPIDRKLKRAAAWFASAVLLSAVAGCITPPATWPLPSERSLTKPGPAHEMAPQDALIAAMGIRICFQGWIFTSDDYRVFAHIRGRCRG